MAEQQFISDTAIFESAMDREERHIKRLLGIIILLICMWFTTIGIFVWYISLPVEESITTVTQDTDGDANTVVGIGDNYGNETDGENIDEAKSN